MKAQHRDEHAIAQQAAEWLTALDDADSRTQGEFAEWIARSPLHVKEFLNATAIHRLFDGMDPSHRLDVQAWLRESGSNVIPLAPESARPAGPQHSAPATHRTRSAFAWRWTAGFAAAATIAVVSWWSAAGSWDAYGTAVGEQRSIELEDGSLIVLSAQSQLQVRIDDASREMRLTRGEALFTVNRDAARPFRVHVGTTVIQALGTQFNVNLRSRDTAVAVIEGAVRVSRGDASNVVPILRAGEEVRIATDGGVSSPAKVDTQRVTAWRERRLVFQDDTLEDMAAQFNRYNRASRIRVEGEEIRQRRFTGVLDASNPESLLGLLSEADDLTFEKRAGELIIRGGNPRPRG